MVIAFVLHHSAAYRIVGTQSILVLARHSRLFIFSGGGGGGGNGATSPGGSGGEVLICDNKDKFPVLTNALRQYEIVRANALSFNEVAMRKRCIGL